MGETSAQRVFIKITRWICLLSVAHFPADLLSTRSSWRRSLHTSLTTTGLPDHRDSSIRRQQDRKRMPTAGESRSRKKCDQHDAVYGKSSNEFAWHTLPIPFMAINYCAATCGRPAPGRKREECLRVLSRGVYGFDTANPPQKPSPTAPCQRWARILTGEIWDGFANYDEKTLAG